MGAAVPSSFYNLAAKPALETMPKTPANSQSTALAQIFCGGQVLESGFHASPAWTQAAAVHEGRIVAVGTEAKVRRDLKALELESETVDLAGGYLIPGFIDAHMHPLFGAVFQDDGLKLMDAQGGFLNHPRAVAEAVSQARFQPAGENDWLVGYGWNPDLAQHPDFNLALLDAVAPQWPVYLLSLDAHFALVNSVGWRKLQPLDYPAGSGEIPRDPAGRPRGLLLETPQFIASLKVLAQMPYERVARAFERFQQAALAAGLTTIADIITDPGVLGIYQRLLRENRLRLRLFTSPYGPLDCHAAMAGQLRTEEHDATRLGLGPEKYLLDGTPGNHNAAWFQVYADQTSTSGYLTLSPDALTAAVERAHREKRDLALHAAGDLSVHYALDAIEFGALRHWGRYGDGPLPARIRIEHFDNVTTVDRDRLSGLARLGLVASVQPTHFHPVYLRVIEKVLGPARMKNEYPLATLTRAGIPVALNSDWPAAMTFAPLEIIAAALAHGEESLDAAAALAGYHHVSALALRAEAWLGRIAPGCAADLVLLDGDPLERRPGQPHIQKLWLNGDRIMV